MCKIPSSCFVLTVAIVMTFGGTWADEQYRVVSGDNLYRIGRKFGIKYQEIMSANRMSKTTIYPNQILIIPQSREKESVPVVPIARVMSPTRVPQAPPAREYADASSRSRLPVNTYENTTVPQDPVKPFVAAKKLPTAPSLANVEDPLGLGYNPNQNSPKSRPFAIRAQPVEPEVIAHKIPDQRSVVQSSPRYIPEAPTSPAWSREVPAVAHYPGKPGADYALDPKQFPMPSFQNPCTASKPGTSYSKNSSGHKTYTVCSGDSVLSISRKFGVPPLKLRHTNGIMFSRIRPGMCLEIPDSNSSIW